LLAKELKIIDLELISYYLGIQIILEANNLWHGVLVEEDTKNIVKKKSTIRKVKSFEMKNYQALKKIKMTLL
jgi:hypothetical protein